MIRPSPKQLELAHWWHREGTKDLDGVIAQGSIRSGKTYAIIIGFLTWSRASFTGQNFIIAGKTIQALKRNVISPMLSILRQMGWTFDYNRSECRIECGGNTYYLFGAAKESSQDVMQGLTAAGCLADEVALFPKAFVDQMVARCSVKGSKLWFDCNPSSPSHFFKTEWVDRAHDLGLLDLHFTMNDNPSLSQDIVSRYERTYTGVFYDRYILGLWTLAEGLVYPDWERAIEEPHEVEAVERVMSCDYGTQNPLHALMCEKDGDGTWHVTGEYRYSGRERKHQKTDADYVADLCAFVDNEPTTIIVDPSATSFIAALRRSGVFIVKKARNDVMDGIRETATAMQLGLVRVSSDLDGLVSEFRTYCWDEKSGNDRPLKENDHGMDALRYLVHTKRITKGKTDYTSPFRGE